MGNPVGTTWSLWRTTKEVSPKVIRAEAALSFKFALIGTRESTERFVETLLTENATEKQRADAANFVRFYESTPEEDTARGFSFIIYVGGIDDPIGVRGGQSVPIAGLLDSVLVGILELRPDLAIALACRFPIFRAHAADMLTQRAAKVNAQIALFSSIAWMIPAIAPVLGAGGMADVILLTKNQAMLVMRLATVYGHKPGYTEQVKEILVTVATALGWRTLARGVAGMIPAGVGAGVKAGIAYSGTVAVGKTAMLYFQRGKMPSSDEIKDAYKNSKPEAESAADALQARAEALQAENSGQAEN
jgi:uncharacterized protein (DUF697 family)